VHPPPAASATYVKSKSHLRIDQPLKVLPRFNCFYFNRQTHFCRNIIIGIL